MTHHNHRADWRLGRDNHPSQNRNSKTVGCSARSLTPKKRNRNPKTQLPLLLSLLSHKFLSNCFRQIYLFTPQSSPSPSRFSRVVRLHDSHIRMEIACVNLCSIYALKQQNLLVKALFSIKERAGMGKYSKEDVFRRVRVLSNHQMPSGFTTRMKQLRDARVRIMYCTLATSLHRRREDGFAAIRAVRVGLSKRIIKRLQAGKRNCQDELIEFESRLGSDVNQAFRGHNACTQEYKSHVGKQAGINTELPRSSSKKIITMMEDMIFELKTQVDNRISPNSTSTPTPKQSNFSQTFKTPLKGVPLLTESKFYTEISDKLQSTSERLAGFTGSLVNYEAQSRKEPQTKPQTPVNPLKRRAKGFLKSQKLETYKNNSQTTIIKKEYVSNPRLLDQNNMKNKSPRDAHSPLRQQRNLSPNFHIPQFRNKTPPPRNLSPTPAIDRTIPAALHPGPSLNPFIPSISPISPISQPSSCFTFPSPTHGRATADHRRNHTCCCSPTQVIYNYFYGMPITTSTTTTTTTFFH